MPSTVPEIRASPSSATRERPLVATGGSGAWPVRAARAVPRILVIAAVSAALGGATSFAQTVLPDPLLPLANSSSGWTLLVVLVVLALRPGGVAAAVSGAAAFVALVLGYQLVSGLRGFPTSETLFLIAGVVVGPFVGVAASWLRRDGWRAAVGAALLAGIAWGEAAYGLLLVVASTGRLPWVLIALLGGGLLVATAARRVRPWRLRVVMTATAAGVAAAFLLTYSAVGSAAL